MTDGEKVIAWVHEHCRIPEGRHVGNPVVLREWQQAEIRKIYDNPAGTRRAILSFGRKNGKTALAAFLLLAHLCGPMNRPNSQLFSAAQSREQAAILFALAAKIVRMSPGLSEYVVVRDSGKELFCPELGTRYKALSADASTAYGLSPVFVVHDELGQVKGERSELYEALETASAAHDKPLSVIISTQAPTDADLLSVLIDDAKGGTDPRVVLSLYTADMEADPFDSETIRQANPAFGDFQNAAEVMAMAEDARRVPSRENSYRNLILNQRVETSSPFVSRAVWESCAAVPEEIHGPVFLGLDLSETNDLTAMVAVVRNGEYWDVYPTFWLPSDGLYERARQDRVPYDVWAREGLIQTTPGNAIEYEWVAHHLCGLFEKWDIRKVAFDRWNWRHFKPWVQKAGLSDWQMDLFEEFGQGLQSMSPALRTLESALLNGKVRHGGHPVLTMCAANAVVESPDGINRKLSKKRSRGRIDGMVALAMALGVASSAEVEEYAVGRLVTI